MILRTIPPTDPLAVEAVRAIRSGDVAAVEVLIREHPDLPRTGFIGRRGGFRTMLHVVADWPGFFPNGPAIVRLLVSAGAEVDAKPEGDKAETPLHWAASSDDADVAEALIEAGANIEMPNGSIGTPLDNAIGYGCWQVAHLLVRRGARVDRLWHAAALGLLPRLLEMLSDATPDEINQAFWHACSGGQRRTAEVLLAHGADMQFVPQYANSTPLAAVTAVETRRQTLAEWLRDRGAT
jgi:uncharacterized protein